MSELDFYKQQMTPFMDNEGWFPDSLLGDSFWVLTYCIKEFMNGELKWRFAP